MLNTAGSAFDYANIVYLVLEECEHRRRAISDHFDGQIAACAQQKLAAIKASYDEIGGTAAYWQTLENEVLGVVVPQYAAAAEQMNARERSNFEVWRGGDIAARAAFALGGLLIGSIIIALPWIPIFEKMFAFALTAAGFIYPDLKRWMYERRYASLLNRLIADSARYQQSMPLRYMTDDDFDKALQLPGERGRHGAAPN